MITVFGITLSCKIVSNVGLKVGEKLLLQQFAKKAKRSAGKKIAFFLRPALYAADALNLEDQGDMIEIEKKTLLERGKAGSSTY